VPGTATVDPHAPCLVGVAQRTWHLAGDDWAPEPLEMAAEVVTAALADAGASGGAAAAVDSLDVVYCMSWPYDDFPARLVERVGLPPGRSHYSGIGGTMPQALLAAAAERIMAGDSEVAVVCGAEALDTKRRAKKAGERLAWSHRHPDPPPFPFEAPFHPSEVAHEVFQAWLTFATRDIARRAHLAVAPDAYRERIGELLSPMTEIAARNPCAWFPETHAAADLITARPDNRMVGYPYTKTMMSIMDVDMAGALVVCSHEAADRLGVPPDRRVYLRGWAESRDAVYVAEHPDLWRSPAMAWSFDRALGAAHVGIDDVAHLDLYSCFASSVHFAADALGIDPVADDRGVTVTGGLPYSGGAASNYLAHAVATMVGVLRDDPGSFGMVTGVGMHMTKHNAFVYSTTPGEGLPEPPGTWPEPATVAISDSWDGSGAIATYSVVHGRDGGPEWGLVVADLPDGTRAYGRVEGADDLAALESTECVGRAVTATPDGPVNRVSL
jgi:acetyl-CoA C-acetyltransferase